LRNNCILLFNAQFREDRDPDNFGSETVGDDAIRAGPGTGIGETFLLVHRHRIEDFVADSCCRRQVLFKGIMLAIADDTQVVLVPNVLVVGIRDRQDYFSPGGGESIILNFGAFAMGGIRKDDSRKAPSFSV
jgi:hypothetical protein